MLDSFGAQLRRHREEQKIDLIAISAQTKIKLSLLEELERDDVSHWPSGLFRRAYIRSYAHAIRLDPDVVVRDFLAAHPDPAEVVTTEAIAAAVDGGRKNTSPPTRLRYIVGSAIESLAKLRRTPAVENLVAAEGGWVDMSSPAPARQPAGEDDAASPWVEPTLAEETMAEALAESAVALADVPSSSQIEPAAVFEPPPQPEPAVPVTAAPIEHATLNASAAASQPDLLAVAQLCTELGCVQSAADVQRVLKETARILDAAGLILWIWDPTIDGLRPALAHGYSDRLLAQLPAVSRSADNATAAAFRSGEACAIDGCGETSGAVVVPLIAADGCAGVLAIELRQGAEPTASRRAVAMIFAALLAQLVGPSSMTGLEDEEDEQEVAPANYTSGLRRTSVQH
jgi:hypothetical protein